MTVSRFTQILGLSVLLCLPVQGQDTEIRPLTTHPAMDFCPAVSSDGQWMAYASEQSGNLDIWIKRLPNGNSVQVTFHQAEDMVPAWSPDNKRLAFVSKRRDAQGDIWIVELDLNRGGLARGEPVQVTDHLGIDAHPSFSPDGREIAYCSQRNGSTNVWVADLATGRSRPVTVYGGQDPCWSPSGGWIMFTSTRFNPGGDLFLVNPEKPESGENDARRVFPLTWGETQDGQGQWSPDGRKVCFLRIDRDTDGDGLMSPDDRGAIWEKELASIGMKVVPERIEVGSGEIQITTDIYDQSDPCWSPSGDIVFSSDRGRGKDIWSIPSTGIFSKAASADEQYAQVLNRFGEAVTQEELAFSIIGYQRIESYFPKDSVWIARALVQMGELHQTMGKMDRAVECFDRVVDEFANQHHEKARTLLLKVTHSSSPVDQKLNECQRIIQEFPEEQVQVAEAFLLLGDLYRDKGESGKSLTSYSRAIQLFPGKNNLQALAHLKIGDLLRGQGQEETAKQGYLFVLREFGDNPLWRKRAGDRLLSQVQGSGAERIEGYQTIIQEFREFPSLAAEAQLAIGQILAQTNQHERAIREYTQVEALFPGLSWALAEAKIAMARSYGILGDELRGIRLLEDVVATAQSVEGGRYADEAKEALFGVLFESGERLREVGDFRLAEARYRKAREYRFDDPRIHLGLVESVFRGGRIRDLIEEYETLLGRNPSDPIVLYSLGLAYSFLGEKEKGPILLDRSNAFLAQALSENHRLIYPYRTLGYNYELLERLDEEKQAEKHGFLVRAGSTLLAPVRWAVGVLPFGKKEKRQGYYEKAIEALMTAVELNDEKGDPRMEALLVQNLANNFYNLGEFGYKNAYQYYRIRLSIDSVFARPLEKAVFFERIGRCCVFLEDTENAEPYLRTAIGLYSELNRDDDVLRNRRMLAFLYNLSGQYEAAISTYETLIAEDQKRGNREDVERSWRNVAYNYSLMGEPEDALNAAKKAEAILSTEKISLKPSEKSALRVEIFGLSIPVWRMQEIGGASSEGFTEADELALVYGLVGRSLESMKRFPEAVAYEEKRLFIFKKRKDAFALRVAMNRLGRLHFLMSEYDQAWDHFWSSWQACKKAKDDAGRLINGMNLAHTAMVELAILGQSDHTAKARACLNEELKRIAEEGEREDIRQKAILHNSLGVLAALGVTAADEADSTAEQTIRKSMVKIAALEAASKHYSEALLLARLAKSWMDEAIILKNMAEAVLSAGDDSSAGRMFQESRKILITHGEDELLWRVEYALGRLARKHPQDPIFNPAEGGVDAYYSRAMDILERLPVQEESSEERLSDRRDRWLLYSDAAVEQLDRGMTEAALQTLERGREKQTADLFARRPPKLKRERDKITWGNLRYLRTQMQEVHQKIIRAENRLMQDPLVPTWLAREQSFEEEYQQLLAKIHEEDPVLAYMAGAETIDLSGIRDLFGENGGALCPLIHSRGIDLWLVDQDTVAVVRIPDGIPPLSARIALCLEKIRKDSLAEEGIRDLGGILLDGTSWFLDSKTWIVVVPDGILWDVPWNALADGGETLSDRVLVTLSPSLACTRLAWEKRKINEIRGLVAGDVMDGILASHMAAFTKRTDSLIGEKATEDEFRIAAASADLVHLGRWMIVNPKEPMASSIVLFPGKASDGFLRAEDLFSMDFRAALAILPSTVNTNDWDWTGFQTLYYGLLYAGVPSVIAPLWPLDREVQSCFYETFYRALGTSSIAEALAEAQTAVRRIRPQIRAWGGFRLLGFIGMRPDEKVRFAAENFLDMVRKGRAFEKQEEFQDAAEAYEKALDMATVIGDTVNLRRIHQEIVRVSVAGQLWTKAIDHQTRLGELARHENKESEVRSSIRNLVALYTRGGNYEEAARTKLEYIRFVEEEGSGENLAPSYEELAFIHALGRNHAEAVQWTEEAFKVYERSGDSLGLGRTLVLKGRFQLEGDRSWEARTDLSNGVRILEEHRMRNPESPVPLELVSGYQLLGLACEKLVLYDDAFASQNMALAILEGLNRPVQVAQGHQYLANLYWQTGDYRNALNHQKTALDGFQTIGDKKYLSMAHSTMGLIQMSLGDLRKAKEGEKMALDLAQQGKSGEDQATILKNMGLIAIQESDFQGAAHILREAVVIDSSLGSRRGMAYDTRNLGILQIRMGNPGQGIPLLRKGLVLSREIQDRRNEVQCLYGLGQAFAQLNDLKSALAVLDSGVVAVLDLSIPELLWRLYRQRAAVLARMGRNEDAQLDYEEAIQIVEGLRAELKVEAFKQGFFDDKMDLYIDAVRHLVAMDRPEEAFDFVERAKSRNFIDLLGNQRLSISQVQGELLEHEKTARQAVQEAQDRLAALVQKGSVLSRQESEEKTRWEGELETRRQAYEAVLLTIQEENPELASMVSVDPWTSRKIMTMLPDSTALVEYFLAQDALLVWVLTNQKLSGRTVAVSRDTVLGKVKQFRESIQAFLSADQDARSLYEILVGPVVDDLKGVRHVVLVPHDLLHYVPFAALVDRQGRFFIEDHSLSLVPSATVLGYCMEKSKAGVSPGRSSSVLALSNPDLGNPVFDLPFADQEVASLRRTYDRVESFSRAQATKQAIADQAPGKDLIHFACHGTYESESPLFSALLLSPSANDDGRLEAHEIFSLRLDCRLVFLSACETGLARITKGDEIIGLARGFIFAGTPSIVTSLWKVDDLATAVLVKRFYRNLKAGMSRASALQKAQQHVMTNLNRHPSAWAAFGLTGDFQ